MLLWEGNVAYIIESMKSIEGQAFNAERPGTVPESESTIRHQEIESLREPMMHVLEQMRERIDRGEYNLIIGDDASGRIPTWVFYNFLKKVYVRNNLPPPSVRYFAGSRNAMGKVVEKKTEEIANHIARFVEKEKQKDNKGRQQKALIVTDTIATGNSLAPIVEALRKNDMPLDVAAVSLFMSERNYEEIKERLHADVFYGIAGSVSYIFGRGDLSGVTKQDANVFSEPVKKYGVAQQKTIREARADSKTLASQLVEWYEAGLSRQSSSEAGRK